MLSANHVAGFSNQLFLQNKLTKQLHFLHVDTNSQKLKVDWLGVVKSWCGQSGAWFLELTVSEEWTDGVAWFFACCYKFM